MDWPAHFVHFSDMPPGSSIMREGPEWLQGGSELRYEPRADGAPAAVLCRFLHHDLARRRRPESWTNPATVISRIFVPLSGTVRVRPLPNGRWQSLQARVFYLLPAGMPFAAVYGRGALVAHHFHLADAAGLPVLNPASGIRRLRDPFLVRRIVEAFRRPCPAALDLAAFSVVLHFLDAHWPLLRLRQAAMAAFAPLVEAVQTQPPALLRLEGLARPFRCSPAALSRRFKRACGLPLKTYILRTLVARAGTLLATTDLPVVRIAERLGYDDPAYFQRVFRRQTGLTPRHWRLRHQNAPAFPAG